ncbi:MAG: threonine/serine dehydratase [Vicinamibacterales bacterium]
MTTADIFAARGRIAPHVRRTPLLPSSWLSALADADVRLKLESLQITNSFKLRGAVNASAAFVERRGEERGPAGRVVTASAGNHGRAMAFAAERLGLPLVVFAPGSAPRAKLDAIARHGADLRAAGTYEDAERMAKAFAIETGATYISPYSHPDVIAGAATVAVEIFEDWPGVDMILASVGGGGLVSGIALANKALSGRVEVVGVECEASPAFHEALKAGRIVEVEVHPTLADGLAGNMDPESITFDLVRRHVDRAVLASESAIADAIRGLFEQDRVVAEGAGATAVAALLSGLPVAGRNVAVVVSGSNIDAGLLAKVLRGG